MNIGLSPLKSSCSLRTAWESNYKSAGLAAEEGDFYSSYVRQSMGKNNGNNFIYVSLHIQYKQESGKKQRSDV